MSRAPVEFSVSKIGRPTRVSWLRFTRNKRRFYMKRFDRIGGRRVPDSNIAGWGFASAMVDALVIEPAAT
jgi:hypothetical protein